MQNEAYGKSCWYVVDGYRPPLHMGEKDDYKGHECYLLLNCNDEDAHVFIDIFYEHKEPIIGIEMKVPARRLKAFYSDEKEVLGVSLDISEQYSMRFRSDVGIVVQYGRMDVNQPNLAYIATMGYAD